MSSLIVAVTIAIVTSLIALSLSRFLRGQLRPRH
jgi:hypothetical protein